MTICWVIRFDDAYLSGYDQYMNPEWGPRDEARRYGVRAVAKASLAKCKTFYPMGADIALVRVVAAPKRSTDGR